MRSGPSSRRPTTTLTIARVAGIQIVAHWSLIVIFLIIVAGLGGGTLAAWHPTWPPPLRWAVAFAGALLFLLSIAAHELSHALVGRRHGIEVDRITLFVFGGMAHMRGFPPTPRAELLMAAAGPLASLVIGIASSGIAALLIGARQDSDAAAVVTAAGPVATLFLWLGPVNVFLALFNVLPGFPLDGGRMLRALLWRITGDLRTATSWASAAGSALGWFLVAFGVGTLLGYDLPLFHAAPGSGLWLMLIGWFLHIAARASYQQVRVREALRDVPVASVMRVAVDTVSPATRVDELVRDHVMRSDQRSFPVVEGGSVLGLVTLDDIRRTPRAEWPARSSGEIMTPLSRIDVLRPEQPAYDALERLDAHGGGELPVLEHEAVKGLVKSEDILRWLTLQELT